VVKLLEDHATGAKSSPHAIAPGSPGGVGFRGRVLADNLILREKGCASTRIRRSRAVAELRGEGEPEPLPPGSAQGGGVRLGRPGPRMLHLTARPVTLEWSRGVR